MPLLVHAVHRPLRVHRQAVQHARLTDGEVGDVDHLLHFAIAFRLDLAGFERDEAAERALVRAQLLADQAHGLAALRRGDRAPLLERLARRNDHALVVGGGRAAHAAEQLAGGGIDRLDERARGVLRPAAVLRPGAGVGFGETQRSKNVTHRRTSTAVQGALVAGLAADDDVRRNLLAAAGSVMLAEAVLQHVL